MGQDRGQDIGAIAGRVLGAAIGFGVGGHQGAAAGADLGGTVSDYAFGKKKKSSQSTQGGIGVLAPKGKPNFLPASVKNNQNSLNALSSLLSMKQNPLSTGLNLASKTLGFLGANGGQNQSLPPIPEIPQMAPPQMPPRLAGLNPQGQSLDAGSPAIPPRPPSEFEERARKILEGGLF